MSNYEDNLERMIAGIVRLKLAGDKIVTVDSITITVDQVVSMYNVVPSEASIIKSNIIKSLEEEKILYAQPSKMLFDSNEHVEWLPLIKENIEWKFWNRYYNYLIGVKYLPAAVVKNIDEVSEKILEKLENPKREGGWNTKGLVVGSVQSGKTANYIGLLCKAIDSGYKLIIVLAGLHDNLRSQTQLRIDEGIIGIDSKKHGDFDSANSAIGVGVNEKLPAISLTNSAGDGDFNKNVGGHIIPLGGHPVIAVVKKNVYMLDNLIKYFKHVEGSIKEDGTGKIIKRFPILVIDDEADNASIDTKPTKPGKSQSKKDVAATNGDIRRLLNCFSRSAYIGYTATPFANLFIEDKVHEIFGQDLFPKNFLINLKPPSNYLGPDRLFGYNSDKTMGLTERKPLPILKLLKPDDYSIQFPPNHKTTHRPTALPASMKNAIKAFIISCAARASRGQGNKHNSMLIHVTKWVKVQDCLAALVDEELAFIKERMLYGEGNSKQLIRNELKEMWDNEFIPVIQEIGKESHQKIEWNDVEIHLSAEAEKIKILTINGSAGDVLEYNADQDGISVIAIGGDKLSRGLTLEGLSVSYFLRPPKASDTLLQMGRWFGYRDGYEDLCRLYTTPQLMKWYRQTALTDIELRDEFDRMADANQTPSNFGFKMRVHPAGLELTSPNKMRKIKQREVSFENSTIQTHVFHIDEKNLTANFKTTEKFIKKIGEPLPPEKGLNSEEDYIWKRVDPNIVINDFLSHYKNHPKSRKSSPKFLCDYILAQNKQGELLEWTVVLKNVNNPKAAILEGLKIGLGMRTNISEENSGTFALPSRELVPQIDAFIDVNESEYKIALEKTQNILEDPSIKQPSAVQIREARDPKRGLLIIYPLHSGGDNAEISNIPIIGFAIIFPASKKAEKIQYKVNQQYEDEYGG